MSHTDVKDHPLFSGGTEMKLRYDLGSMTPGVLVTPRRNEIDLTLTGGLNSFTLRGSAATIRAQLTDAIAVLDLVQADGITRYRIKEV